MLNRPDRQQSGSMSAAQDCGGENSAEGGCRQSQSQLDRVSFAHVSKPFVHLIALAFKVAAGDPDIYVFTLSALDVGALAETSIGNYSEHPPTALTLRMDAATAIDSATRGLWR